MRPQGQQYIALNYNELERYHNNDTIPRLSRNHPLKALVPYPILVCQLCSRRSFVLMFQYSMLRAI